MISWGMCLSPQLPCAGCCMIPAGCVEIYLPELCADLPCGRMRVEAKDELWKLLWTCSKGNTAFSRNMVTDLAYPFAFDTKMVNLLQGTVPPALWQLGPRDQLFCKTCWKIKLPEPLFVHLSQDHSFLHSPLVPYDYQSLWACRTWSIWIQATGPSSPSELNLHI